MARGVEPALCVSGSTVVNTRSLFKIPWYFSQGVSSGHTAKLSSEFGVAPTRGRQTPCLLRTMDTETRSRHHVSRITHTCVACRLLVKTLYKPQKPSTTLYDGKAAIELSRAVGTASSPCIPGVQDRQQKQFDRQALNVINSYTLNTTGYMYILSSMARRPGYAQHAICLVLPFWTLVLSLVEGFCVQYANPSLSLVEGTHPTVHVQRGKA